MELEVLERVQFGRKTKALRKEGFVPAEFYGRAMPNRHLAVKMSAFNKLFRIAGENTIIELVENGKKQPALIYHVQRNFLTDEPAHIDFYGVRMDEEIKTKVPVEFVGEAPAIKEKGGVLAKNTMEIEIEALPSNLPHSFIVDISVLVELNQSIYVRDLVAPKNVTILSDLETPIVTIAAPREEEVAPVTPVDLSTVKVETEEKKAERDATKEKEETV